MAVRTTRTARAATADRAWVRDRADQDAGSQLVTSDFKEELQAVAAASLEVTPAGRLAA